MSDPTVTYDEHGNPSHHQCSPCGFWWEHGKNGGHHCKARLVAQLARLRTENAELQAALKEIIEAEDAPQDDYESFLGCGLFCGAEDLDLQDRYDGALYGYSTGNREMRQWAESVAEAAIANATAQLPDPDESTASPSNQE